MNVLTVMQTLLPLAVLIVVASLLSYGITWLIIKKYKKLIFLVPILLMMATIGFAILGFMSQDWGRLGYLIMAFTSLGAFFGALISSFVLRSKQKNQS